MHKSFQRKLSRDCFESEELFNFANKVMKPNFEVPHNCNELLNPTIRKLSSEEISMIEAKTKCQYTHANVSDRISIKGCVYWSKNYAKKGKSDSYTICFQHKKSQYFGEIIEFLELNNKFYCLVSPFQIANKFIDYLPQSDCYFSELSQKDLFERFFYIFEYSTKIILINCDNILNKCIVVKNENLKFITRIMYEFEHD
jgi:hypothetical protein